jgi:hypothetical protein
VIYVSDVFSFFSNTTLLIACCGIIQFFAQFIIGVNAAFYLDLHSPAWLTMRGFNVMNPLGWDSPILKSNGVFLLEPSFFNQLTAIAVVIELTIFKRIIRLLIYLLALIVSFSGTGVTMLLLFAPYFLYRHASQGVTILGTLMALVAFVFGSSIFPDAILSRADEFAYSESSGFARFVSPLIYIPEYSWIDSYSTFFGRGAGSVAERLSIVSYASFDPTWAKILYEFGLLGGFTFLLFFCHCIIRGQRGLRFALGYTFLLLGGYLLNTVVLVHLTCLVVWLRDQSWTEECEAPPQHPFRLAIR